MGSEHFDSEEYGTEAGAAGESDVAFWADFDLKQEKYVPGLDLTIHAPLVIIPNLNVDGARFEVDFGTINIKSTKEVETGRWINHPAKEFISMAIQVDSYNAKVNYYNNTNIVYDPILKEEKLTVNILVPSPSPYLIDPKSGDYSGPIKVNDTGVTFDPSQVDVSVSISIKQSLLKLKFKQDVVTEVFDILEHNIMKKDKYS